MTDKKEEWEIGYSRENPAEPPMKTNTVDFEQPDALVGTMLDGRFLIEKNLTDTGADKGGIGLVYLAQDLKLMGKATVVKILQKNSLKNQDIARKFQHEKEALIRLDHPNIVRILDSGELTDGNPFMVMEFIEGYSLRRKMRQGGKLPFDFAAHLIESVTDALGAAHAKKILHRDIKPDNIMLTPQEEAFEWVRLIDFGIARVEDSLIAPATQFSRTIGTISYMAPEQLAGEIEQTPAVDVYSFAILVYEMLTGELPFKAHTVTEMFVMQKEGLRVLPSALRNDLPPEVERLLFSALAYNFLERPQNIRQFGREMAKTLRVKSGMFPETFAFDKTGQEFENDPSGNLSHETAPKLAKTVPSNLKSVETILSPAPTQPSIGGVQETNFPNINYQSPERKKSNKSLFAALAGLLILAAIAIPVGLYIRSNNGKDTAAANSVNSNPANKLSNTAETNNPANEATREISYHLLVQKMRGGKAFEEPFKSSGQEIFENGYKFKMVFESDAAGYFYIFNEDKDADGKTIYNILYPTPKTNNGSAEVKAKQTIETNQNTFSGDSTTEIVWLIWTAEKRDDLETARTSAFEGQGTIRDEKNVRLLSDFVQKYKDKKLETSKDTPNRQTIVKGTGDVIVQKIELEHR